MSDDAKQPVIEQEIQLLTEERANLLSQDDVMWDEVNAIERELKFLRQNAE